MSLEEEALQYVVTSSKGNTDAYPAALLATLLQFQLNPSHSARGECDYAVANGSSSSFAHAYNLTLQGYMQCTYERVALMWTAGEAAKHHAMRRVSELHRWSWRIRC